MPVTTNYGAKVSIKHFTNDHTSQADILKAIEERRQLEEAKLKAEKEAKSRADLNTEQQRILQKNKQVLEIEKNELQKKNTELQTKVAALEKDKQELQSRREALELEVGSKVVLGAVSQHPDTQFLMPVWSKEGTSIKLTNSGFSEAAVFILVKSQNTPEGVWRIHSSIRQDYCRSRDSKGLLTCNKWGTNATESWFISSTGPFWRLRNAMVDGTKNWVTLQSLAGIADPITIKETASSEAFKLIDLQPDNGFDLREMIDQHARAPAPQFRPPYWRQVFTIIPIESDGLDKEDSDLAESLVKINTMLRGVS